MASRILSCARHSSIKTAFETAFKTAFKTPQNRTSKPSNNGRGRRPRRGPRAARGSGPKTVQEKQPLRETASKRTENGHFYSFSRVRTFTVGSVHLTDKTSHCVRPLQQNAPTMAGAREPSSGIGPDDAEATLGAGARPAPDDDVPSCPAGWGRWRGPVSAAGGLIARWRVGDTRAALVGDMGGARCRRRVLRPGGDIRR